MRQKIKGQDRMLKKECGGELLVQAKNGRIRSKDTIPSGIDPCPPKDREILGNSSPSRS